jgi:hypothetical protein
MRKRLPAELVAIYLEPAPAAATLVVTTRT